MKYFIVPDEITGLTLMRTRVEGTRATIELTDEEWSEFLAATLEYMRWQVRLEDCVIHDNEVRPQ